MTTFSSDIGRCLLLGQMSKLKGFLTYPVKIYFLFLLKEDIEQSYARQEKTPSLAFEQ
jgi:hypothetical protein